MRPQLVLLPVLLSVAAGALLWARWERAEERASTAAAARFQADVDRITAELANYQHIAASMERDLAGVGKRSQPRPAPSLAEQKAQREAAVARGERMRRAEALLLARRFAASHHLSGDRLEAFEALIAENHHARDDISRAAVEAKRSLNDPPVAALAQQQADSFKAQLTSLLGEDLANDFSAYAAKEYRSIPLGYLSARMVETGAAPVLSGDQIDRLVAVMPPGAFVVSEVYTPTGASREGLQNLPVEQLATWQASMDGFLEASKPILSPEQYAVVENEVKMSEINAGLSSLAYATWRELRSQK